MLLSRNMEIITDEKKIEEVLTRGVENIYPNKEVLKKILLSGKRIKLYCGYDPTAKSLHIGNAISINKLGQFQKLGHEIIFLIGDFTGMIGDPTDKTTTRKKLTRLEVLENSKNYVEQVSGYLKFNGENPAKVKYNSEWNDKLSFKNLIELSSNFTLQQMINRKMFKRELAVVKCEHCGAEWAAPIQFGSTENFNSVTLVGNKTNCPNCGKMTGLNKENIAMKEIDQIRETPIGFHELLYPFAQAYDSLAMQVDLEIGGNDQMFNMLCGRDMMKLKNVNELYNLSKNWWQRLIFWDKKEIKPKEKFVLTMKLLADETGKKMGKTEGNIVNLDETAENMFGKIMAWGDSLIGSGFELCTNLSIKEVDGIKEKLKDKNNNPKDLKIKLAYEITKINHGEKKAKEAEESFINTFSKRGVPDNVLEISAKEDIKLVDVLLAEKIITSKAEFRRLIGEGAVTDMDKNEKIINTDSKASKAVYKIGKHRFIKIK
jgi:tyrosyl-tRNA synthetase